MSTLLVIQSFEGAKQQVFRQQEYYRLPGWPILGVCPANSHHDWPAGITPVLIGKSSGYSTPDTIRYYVSTWEYVLENEPSYSTYLLTEYDSVIIRQPEPHPGGLLAKLGGGEMAGFKAKQFYHFPHFADHRSANIIASEGRKLIDEGEFEHGSPDVFLGLIKDRRPDLEVHEANTFSVNGGDLTNRKGEAIKAIKEGAWLCHGLRTQEELDWILAARDSDE